MRRVLLMLLAAAMPGAVAQEDAKPVDVGAVLRKSPAFRKKLAQYEITFDHEKGIVRAVGEIGYRGGGPCEFLCTVYPAKSHETIVLLDNGPFQGEGRRPRKGLDGLATTLNNAMLAAGFKKGKPFSWDDKTGEVFPPKGEVVYLYCEWKDAKGKLHVADMADWLWNYKTLEVMERGKYVYTGSLIIDEGPPRHKMWFGAEVDGLLVGVLNTSTALIDNTEEGSLDNGAYEAVHQRIPEIGTRITLVLSRKALPSEEFEPLEIPEELQKERARRAAEKKKAAAEKDSKPDGKNDGKADGKPDAKPDDKNDGSQPDDQPIKKQDG